MKSSYRVIKKGEGGDEEVESGGREGNQRALVVKEDGRRRNGRISITRREEGKQKEGPTGSKEIRRRLEIFLVKSSPVRSGN